MTSESKDSTSQAWRVVEGAGKVTAFIVAGAAIGLGLLGFGATLSIESKFGLPHDALFSSWTGLQSLGSMLFLRMAGRAADFLANVRILRVFALTLPAIAIIAVAFSVLSWLHIRGIIELDPSKRRQRSTNRSVHRKLFWSWLVTSSALLLSAPTMALFFIASSMILITVPAIGFYVGEEYLDELIVDTKSCLPRRTLSERRASRDLSAKTSSTRERVGATENSTGYSVPCVAAVKGKACSAGRVVSAAAEYIVLYRPTDGKVEMVPLDDTRLIVVPDLDAGLPDECQGKVPAQDIETD